MDYRIFGETIYIRIDKNEEIISRIISVCRTEGIKSASFSGIGGCLDAELQTFIPEKSSFETEYLKGMLELVSLNGNITRDNEGEYYHHTHGAFAYKENGQHLMRGGHLKSSRVLYTAEIELRPVKGGIIERQYDPETGTGFWKLN